MINSTFVNNKIYTVYIIIIGGTILTISSILRMERTHSAASVMAEVDTKSG